MGFPAQIVGNMTADPELRYTQNGLPVTGFTVAVNERRLNRQTNEWEDGEATFVRCSAWRETAEHVAASLTKGTRVMVTGKITLQEFETKDGTKGAALEMQVDDIGPSLRYATAQVTKAPRPQGVNPGAPMAMQPPPGYGQQTPPGYGQQPQQWQQPQQQPGQGQPQTGWAQPGAYGDDTPF